MRVFPARRRCVLEVFTWLRMGGKQDRIVVMSLESIAASKGGEGGAEGRAGANAAALEWIACFDAASARCTSPPQPLQRLG